MTNCYKSRDCFLPNSVLKTMGQDVMEKKEKCHLQCWSQWLILMFLFLSSATVTGKISPYDMHCSGWQHWQNHVVARNPSRMGLPLSREVEIYLTLVNPFFLGIPARDLLEETEIQYLQSKSVEDTKQRVKTTEALFILFYTIVNFSLASCLAGCETLFYLQHFLLGCKGTGKYWRHMATIIYNQKRDNKYADRLKYQ